MRIILVNKTLLYYKSSWYILKLSFVRLIMGHAVAQFVEALRCKPEGRGFDSRLCHWNFSLTYSFRLHYGTGVDSACNRNEYDEDRIYSRNSRTFLTKFCI